MEHHPAGRRAATRDAGWTTVEAAADAVDTMYAAGAIDAADTTGGADLHENGFAVVRSGSQSALARKVDGELRLISHSAPEAWGLRSRSKEQRFALELLLDPDVSVVALDGKGAGRRWAWNLSAPSVTAVYRFDLAHPELGLQMDSDGDGHPETSDRKSTRLNSSHT